MIKIKSLCLISVAMASIASLAHSFPAEAAKEKFERTKPHVNVQTRGERPTKPGKPAKPGKPSKPGHNAGKAPGSMQTIILPDLVFRPVFPSGPLPGAPNTGYCGKQGGTAVASEVVVGVYNKSSKPVQNTYVSVNMRSSPNSTLTVNKPIGPLGPGAVGSVTFPILKGAWKKGRAKFKMNIDTGNHVNEGVGENNNQLEYACIAPAG